MIRRRPVQHSSEHGEVSVPYMMIKEYSELLQGANNVWVLQPTLTHSHVSVHVLLGISSLDHLGQDLSSSLVAGNFLL